MVGNEILVQNKTEIMQPVLKMHDISLLTSAWNKQLKAFAWLCSHMQMLIFKRLIKVCNYIKITLLSSTALIIKKFGHLTH